MAHTPGPWRVDPDERAGMEYNNHVITEAGGRICFMAHGGPARQDEFDANARLIAAAPDLLAALKSAAAAIDDCLNCRGHLGYAALKIARDAIAKAEGAQS